MILQFEINSSLGHRVEDWEVETLFEDMQEHFNQAIQTLRKCESKDLGETEYLMLDSDSKNGTVDEMNLFYVLAKFYEIKG